MLSSVYGIRQFLRCLPNLSTLYTLERGCCEQSMPEKRGESHSLSKCDPNPHCVPGTTMGDGGNSGTERKSSSL